MFSCIKSLTNIFQVPYKHSPCYIQITTHQKWNFIWISRFYTGYGKMFFFFFAVWLLSPVVPSKSFHYSAYLMLGSITTLKSLPLYLCPLLSISTSNPQQLTILKKWPYRRSYLLKFFKRSICRWVPSLHISMKRFQNRIRVIQTVSHKSFRDRHNVKTHCKTNVKLVFLRHSEISRCILPLTSLWLKCCDFYVTTFLW